jgi:hypothetical protein
MQKIKHELIQPRPGQPPRYDNIIIMVGEDQAGMNIAQALMKAVNKFKGYEHVKVSLEATPRGTGMSFSKLRNILKDPNATEEQQLSLWTQGFDVNKLGVDWIKHLMDVTRKGMGIQKQPQQPAPQPVPVAERLFNALTRPAYISELDTKKTWADYGILDAETEKKKKEQVYHGWQDYEDKKSTKDDEKETDTDEAMSAGVRMQRALQREKEKGDYSRRYAEKHFPIGKKPEPIKEPQKDQSVSEITNKDAIKQYKDIQNYKHVDRPKQDEKEFLRISVNRSKKQSTVAEGSSGAKYKVRSIGQDKKGEYYISPSTGEKVYKKAKVGDHEVPGSKEIKPKLESMLPKTTFAGSDKNKLGPAAHLKGSMKRPARQGDLVGSADEGVETEDQRLDPKCWKGYRKAGTKMKGGTRVNNCVPVREDIEDLMAGYIKLLESKK